MLNADDVEKKMIRRRLVDGNGPSLVECIDPLVTVLYRERVLDGEGDLSLLSMQIHHFAKFDFAEILCLIPKVYLLTVKLALHPGEKQSVLMRMICRIIASEFLTRRRVDRMNVAATTKVFRRPFGNWLRFLDVLENWFSAQHDKDRVIRLGQLEFIASGCLCGNTERRQQKEQSD